MFSKQYVERINAFNLFFQSSMLIYTLFWGNKWTLFVWIPLTALAISLYRKNAIQRAHRG